MKSIIPIFSLIISVSYCIAQNQAYKVEFYEAGDSTQRGTLYRECDNFFDARLFSRPQDSSDDWKRVKDLKGLSLSCNPDEAIITMLKPGAVSIYAKQRHVKLTVYFQGQAITMLSYDTKQVPDASVRITNGKTIIDPKQGLPLATKRIELEAFISDPYFVSTRKKDTKLVVTGFTLSLRKSTTNINGKGVDLGPLHLKANDTLFVSGVKTKRIIYNGNTVEGHSGYFQYIVIR